jgi:hypothetical protein
METGNKSSLFTNRSELSTHKDIHLKKMAIVVVAIIIIIIIIINKTIILPVVLYGCETWSLALREEHRLRVFEKRVLRGIFGLKRDEVIDGWRKLHNEELHNLYGSPSIIRTIKSRRMRWAGHVARMGEKRNAYRILVGKPEGKRPLERSRHR